MKTRSLATLSLAGLLATNAFALPDPKADTSKVNGLLDGIGQVIGDHKVPNLVYVKPSDLKVIGTYYPKGLGGNCANLFEFRNQFTSMPHAARTQELIKNGEYYSPLFEMTFGFDARNTKTLSTINNYRLDYIELRKQHADLIAEYESSYQEKEAALRDIEEAKKDYDVAYDRFVKELSTAQTDAEKNEIRANFKEEKEAYRLLSSQLTAKKRLAMERFNKALMNWGPYKSNLEEIKKYETDMVQTLGQMKKTTKESYEYGMELLNEMNNKVVGRATVGYSLSTNERVALLSKRIKDAGLNVDVRALDVFNVKMNPSLVKIDTDVKDGVNGNYQLASYIIDSKSQVTPGTTMTRMKLPATIQRDGEKPEVIEFDVPTFQESSGASQSFEMPITAGSVCGEPVMKVQKFTAEDEEGNKVEKTITYPEFTQPGDKVLYAQNVPLLYNFYQKAEKIEGQCRLDISKTSNYVREKGKKKSGGFFSRKTKSWDNTKHDYDNDMGLHCSIVRNPIGSSPEESEAINDAIEKSLYQDMYSMFIASYAKDFQIIPLNPTELGVDAKIFDKIGTGFMNMCGKNKYCEFGGVVLKTLDELAGSRHSGTSSSKQTMTGTIVKTINVDSYVVSEGSVNVELQVCVDQKACK